jgi:hypothetical protein
MDRVSGFVSMKPLDWIGRAVVFSDSHPAQAVTFRDASTGEPTLGIVLGLDLFGEGMLWWDRDRNPPSD